MALIGTVSGSNGTSNTAVSGTLVIADGPAASFPSIQSDAVLFVSGAIGGGSRAVIGGDALVSGSLTGSNILLSGDLAVNGGDITTTASTFNLINTTATTVNIGGGASTGLNAGNSSGANNVYGQTKFNQGLSGSLTKLSDGSSYIKAGNYVTVTSESNGSITIASTTFSPPTGSIVAKSTVSFTSTTSSFVVPAGVTSIDAKLWGAGGGTGGYNPRGGGSGGFASGTFTVTPGETLYIIVGGGGQAATGSSGDAGYGGWGGGGNGAKGDASGGGGGGYTGIFTGSVEQINSIIIAGGGGGGTGFAKGGAGGGTTGNTGGTFGTAIRPGGGGSQSAGGYGGYPAVIYSGSALLGGNAGGPSTDRTTTGDDDGGGGGGGYFGGGGGAQDASGGGGGSGYYHPSKVSGGYLETGNDGDDSGNGLRSNPPKTSDTDYAGIIGTGGGVVSGQGQDGGNGLVILSYTRATNADYWYEAGPDAIYTTASVVIGNNANVSSYGSDIFVYISGSASEKSVFGGDVGVSGSLTIFGNTVTPAVFSSTTVTTAVGNNTIYSVLTSSCNGMFVDYTARSGSNARAGHIVAIRSGSSVNFNETATTDFGSTSGVTFGFDVASGNMSLTGSTSTANWTIKVIARSI